MSADDEAGDASYWTNDRDETRYRYCCAVLRTCVPPVVSHTVLWMPPPLYIGLIALDVYRLLAQGSRPTINKVLSASVLPQIKDR